MAKNKKRKKQNTSRTQKKKLNREQLSIAEEAKYIIKRAKDNESRVVSLGSLIFFSTETGDAWVLDCEDELALCLAKDGEKQSFTIFDTPTQFGIEWNSNYYIDGEKFIIIEYSGKIRTIIGYPTMQILKLQKQRINEK